jgi:ribosomal protein S18 acetylase RimI-like enzyme
MPLNMSWKPMGQLFNPLDHDLPMGCKTHSQSPQTIILDDRFRVYCTSRARDEGGKFLSKVIYVDFDFDWNFIRHSNGEIIPQGELGTFDEHGIFPFSPFKDGDKITAYTCGWSRRVSVDVETATGFAQSHDGGVTFQKLGNGPVFASSLHEPMLVGDSFVRKCNDIYHMWYMYGTKWVKETNDSKPDRVYKIGHAASNDGVNWTPDNAQIIPDILHDNECQALPSVLHHNGIYHMVFCYRDVFGFRDDPSKGYRIGYAYSVDGQYWVRDDDLGGLNNAQGVWDNDMMSYPHLMQHNDKIYCLYNGNKFGREGFGGYQFNQSGLMWKHNQADKNKILNHFQNCDEGFIDELSSRVDMGEYSQKLIDKAQRFEIWNGEKLVGLLAVYWNNETDHITNVSVDKNYMGQGYGTDLVKRCVNVSTSHGKKTIELEVKNDNQTAINLYTKHGFQMARHGGKYSKATIDLR